MSKAADNVVIFDNRGIPSVMVRFERPQDTAEIPAMFKIGNMVADAIYISKYANTIIEGMAYSLPMVDPAVNINFDEAVQVCRAKGKGWHLMTAVEFEYLLNESRKQNTLSHGNTDWSKDYYHKDQHENNKGCGYGRTLTGSGPAAWNHDYTIYGVSNYQRFRRYLEIWGLSRKAVWILKMQLMYGLTLPREKGCLSVGRRSSLFLIRVRPVST